VRSAERRHQSPERTVLSQVNCIVHIEVAGFQILLIGFHPCSTMTHKLKKSVYCHSLKPSLLKKIPNVRLQQKGNVHLTDLAEIKFLSFQNVRQCIKSWHELFVLHADFSSLLLQSLTVQ